MFPPPPVAASSSSSEANMSSPDAEITIRAELCKKNSMTSSMPNYDLNKLFSGVQDSGGEGMMAFTPEMDENMQHLLMTSASEIESEASKPGSEMADSTVSMTSWSTTTDDFSSSS